MRVIAGTLKGREFNSPRRFTTHPMGDKVRGALFSRLGDIEGLTVFDPYGGSGALSFEALSRGAARATIIELDKLVYRTIKDNVAQLGLTDQVESLCTHCVRWSKRNPDRQYDLVLCDPPYDQVLLRDIEQLASHTRMGGVLVLSWPEHLGVETLSNFELLKQSVYAGARLAFYRRIR